MRTSLVSYGLGLAVFGGLVATHHSLRADVLCNGSSPIIDQMCLPSDYVEGNYQIAAACDAVGVVCGGKTYLIVRNVPNKCEPWDSVNHPGEPTPQRQCGTRYITDVCYYTFVCQFYPQAGCRSPGQPTPVYTNLVEDICPYFQPPPGGGG